MKVSKLSMLTSIKEKIAKSKIKRNFKTYIQFLKSKFTQ